MTKKQTAVEWLLDKITQNGEIRWRGTRYIELFQQAKDMETKQLSKSYHKGVRHEWEGAGGNFEDYYEETYGNDTSI
jgi:hypothetical protein